MSSHHQPEDRLGEARHRYEEALERSVAAPARLADAAARLAAARAREETSPEAGWASGRRENEEPGAAAGGAAPPAPGLLTRAEFALGVFIALPGWLMVGLLLWALL